MSTLNKVLLACLLVIFAISAVVLLSHYGGQRGAQTVAIQATPTSTPAGTQPPATPPVRHTPGPTPPPRIVKPMPVEPGATPVDEAAAIASIRADVDSGDPAKREAALNRMAFLLAERKGASLMKEWIVSGKKDLQDEVLSLLPNMNEDDRLPLLNLALDAKDPEFRTNMLTQVRDVISTDPEKVALNDLVIKGIKDPDPSVQEEAADLFMYFGDAENDGPLYTAAKTGLVSDSETVRENAMSYLEDNHTVASILALTEALQSKYPDIVEKAGEALRFITDAEIPSNKFDDWAKWCREHGTEWGKENDRTLP